MRLIISLLLLLCTPVSAETLLIASRGSLLNTASSLIKFDSNQRDGKAIKSSLFIGSSGASLFAPAPQSAFPRSGSAIERLRALIGQAESVMQGYNAVQHGAKTRPPKLPTQMTLGEIYDWIDATPGQPHAIGRYQFIPKTLRRLASELGVPRHAVFNARLQDQLSDELLIEAGLDAFRAGEITRHAFMHNLSKIWAGLPTSTGKSYYHGFAGNRASITWTHFDAEMARIFG